MPGLSYWGFWPWEFNLLSISALSPAAAAEGEALSPSRLQSSCSGLSARPAASLRPLPRLKSRDTHTPPCGVKFQLPSMADRPFGSGPCWLSLCLPPLPHTLLHGSVTLNLWNSPLASCSFLSPVLSHVLFSPPEMPALGCLPSDHNLQLPLGIITQVDLGFPLNPSCPLSALPLQHQSTQHWHDLIVSPSSRCTVTSIRADSTGHGMLQNE